MEKFDANRADLDRSEWIAKKAQWGFVASSTVLALVVN